MSAPQRIVDVVTQGALRFSDRPALRDEGRVLSYRDLAGAVAATSASLAALGVRAGDRVLVVAENEAAPVVLLFAIGRLDAWPVLATARLGPREIDTMSGAPARRSSGRSVKRPHAAVPAQGRVPGNHMPRPQYSQKRSRLPTR